MTSQLIGLKSLSCERDGRTLFTGLNFDISKGDVVQVLGPNGSGKTTLLRILTGISSDFDGEITWRDQSVSAARVDFQSQLLYIGHQPAVQKSLTVSENLRWFSGLNAGESSNTELNIDQALQEVALSGYDDSPCHTLSAGQLRRVALARLYLSAAPIWVLDEPFTAIDVNGVARLAELIGAHSAKGGVVILTSHQDLGIENVSILDLGDFPEARVAG